ncbi:MAG: TIGR04563 family protein [Deltaproteobacteria bacterium]|nr:TIGR04563 family protein [Deltaproteobacteria bacterium]
MDKRKQSLYFPEDMLNDLKKEAERVDRSLSWVVQRCIKAAMKEIKSMPSSTLPEPSSPPQQEK